MKKQFFQIITTLKLYLLFILLLTTFSSPGKAQVFTVDMVPPIGGVAHSSSPFTNPPPTPDTIMSAPLSTDQDLVNLFDNDVSTFYQPDLNSNPGTIGSDVLVDFDFGMIPNNATILDLFVTIVINDTDSELPYERAVGLLSYNRMDLTRYFDISIGPPGTKGLLVYSPNTPVFFIPALENIQVPVGSVIDMHINPIELTLDNARNLSAVITGINDARVVFDRIALVNATVVYSVPLALDVAIEGPGSGNISSVPADIDCPGTCSEDDIPPGGMITLIATPDAVSEFVEWTGDCSGTDPEITITIDADTVCVAVFQLIDFVLNPIFPALDDNINFISAEQAYPGGNVAFVWGKQTGSFTIGGQVCNGTELGINNPNLLAIVPANQEQVATYIFYIPTFSDLEFEVQLQAIDITSCRTSNIIPQIIRKDESG